MALLVRTWNVFHGNALPPRRRGYLREMIELVCSDSPDVVCLQEVPVWGIARLEEWSSMQALTVVARAPRIPGRAGARVTRWNQGFFRSAFVGQANAILVSRSLATEERGHLQISDPGRERRIVHAVSVAGRYLVANLHANRGREVARLELERARAFAEAAVSARRDSSSWRETSTCSDFELAGYSPAADGIDHVLVAGRCCVRTARVAARATRARRGGSLGSRACRGRHPVTIL